MRYADDFLVVTKTEKAAQRVFESVERYLTRKLYLVVNHQKNRVCSANDYLAESDLVSLYEI